MKKAIGMAVACFVGTAAIFAGLGGIVNLIRGAGFTANMTNPDLMISCGCFAAFGAIAGFAGFRDRVALKAAVAR